MPVVENCENKTGFLCRHPLLDFKQESNVPILMGMNSGEGGLFAARELLFFYINILNNKISTVFLNYYSHFM